MNQKYLKQVMYEYGVFFAAHLQRIVAVKTGALKKSITFKSIKNTPQGFEVDIEALYYFTFLDQGTRFIVARHYLDKATKETNRQFNKRIAEAAAKDYTADIKLQLTRP